jgi:hypothetical protein
MDVLSGVLAAAAYGATAWGCWRLGARLGERLGKRAGEGVAGAAAAATLGMVLLVNWFPSSLPAGLADSPAIHLEFSYFPPTALLLFGLGARRVPRRESARALAVLAAVLGLYGGAHLFLSLGARSLPSLSASPPPGPVALQTTGWSCGAASCVTLLRARGIASTEREMGELCLTMPFRGTTTLRFVRGLTRKLREAGSPLRVAAADRLSVSDLDTFPLPCILGIRWTLFTDHAVVLMGRDGEGRWRVADPLVGRVEPWPEADLAARFTGEAIGLE